MEHEAHSILPHMRHIENLSMQFIYHFKQHLAEVGSFEWLFELNITLQYILKSSHTISM